MGVTLSVDLFVVSEFQKQFLKLNMNNQRLNMGEVVGEMMELILIQISYGGNGGNVKLLGWEQMVA